jgi:iron-regulated transporter 1
MFDLMVQELEQVEIPATQRSTFAGTEQSFDSFFSLCHWGATVIWSRPEDFKWLALGSCSFLASGTVIFAAWSRQPAGVKEAGYDEVPLHDLDSNDW